MVTFTPIGRTPTNEPLSADDKYRKLVPSPIREIASGPVAPNRPAAEKKQFPTKTYWRFAMAQFVYRLWTDQEGQDVAEYAVMLAVVLVIVLGTVRVIGANAGNIFSQVGSSLQ